MNENVNPKVKVIGSGLHSYNLGYLGHLVKLGSSI
jgi:hypothetical protein